MAQKLVTNNSGGMNNKVSPIILKDSECELILNYHLDEVGAFTKRRGYTVFASQPADGKTIFGIGQFAKTSTNVDNFAFMVANNSADTNTTIYANDGGTWTSVDTIATARGTNSNFQRIRFLNFVDYLFRIDPLSVVETSIDGTTWATTNAPATIVPSFGAVFQDRVYLANDNRSGANKEGSRVYFSSLPSAGAITWTTATDFFDVNPDDGDEITALENNGNRLLIFKNRALYRWTFGQTEADRLIGVGTASQECVKTNFDLGITFFANEYGAYAYDGGRPKLISRKMQKWFDAAAVGSRNFAAEVDEDHYFLYIGDSISVEFMGETRVFTNVMLVYTISLDAWTVYTLNVPVRVMGKILDIDGDGDIDASDMQIIIFGSTTGRTYRWDNGNSDDSGGASENTATNIAGEIITKEHFLSFPEKSVIKYVDVIARQGQSANVQIFYDRNVDPKPLGNLTGRISSFNGRGKEINSVQLRITDNSQVQSIIEGFNFEYEPNEKRK